MGLGWDGENAEKQDFLAMSQQGLEPWAIGLKGRDNSEVTADNTGLTPSAQRGCPLCCPSSVTDHDLQRLMMAWGRLPADVRSVVMRLVDAVDRSSPDGTK